MVCDTWWLGSILFAQTCLFFVLTFVPYYSVSLTGLFKCFYVEVFIIVISCLPQSLLHTRHTKGNNKNHHFILNHWGSFCIHHTESPIHAVQLKSHT